MSELALGREYQNKLLKELRGLKSRDKADEALYQHLERQHALRNVITEALGTHHTRQALGSYILDISSGHYYEDPSSVDPTHTEQVGGRIMKFDPVDAEANRMWIEQKLENLNILHTSTSEWDIYDRMLNPTGGIIMDFHGGIIANDRATRMPTLEMGAFVPLADALADGSLLEISFDDAPHPLANEHDALRPTLPWAKTLIDAAMVVLTIEKKA